MMLRRPALVVLSAIAFALLAGDQVQARTVYDGGWSVVIAGQSGACAGSSYRFGITILNGIIRYGGGGLGQNTGSGTWRGRSSQGACAGVWSAQRRTDF